ncbi:MAG: response regulator [Chitinophagaceae bacterium]|nr:response regulator [Chitinophagaceae bacterium]
MKWYTKLILVGVFSAIITLIVLLQLNSGKSVNSLIEGNQKLLRDFNIKADLEQLKANVVVLESKVRSLVIAGYVDDTEYLEFELKEINKSLERLKTNQFDPSVLPLLSELEDLVDHKVYLNQQILDTFRFRGKLPAERMINMGNDARITDSITHVIRDIDAGQRETITGLVEKADERGDRVRNLGNLMTLIAILASLLTFLYAALKVRQQEKLIKLLNISEKKALQAGKAKETFLSNISHELRTPLNAIIGFANLLSKQKLDPESESHVRTIHIAGENLLAIINDVLDASKIDAGMMKLEKSPFNLSALIRSVEAMFKAQAQEKGLQFKVTLDEDVPVLLLGDQVRLTQILMNILSNAFKFTHSGSVLFSIYKVSETDREGVIGFSVNDTGIGIEEGKIAQIFDRFRQAEETVTREYGGTGLGLSIVKDLVELQAGTISVKSEPGKGTAFTIQIPFLKNLLDSEAVDISPNDEAPLYLDNCRILVAEDNEINRQLLQHLFRRWQVSYKIVNNGREVIDELKHNHYQCILLDIQMPEMDGYSALEVIRKEHKLTIPVIAMTAHVLQGEREKCLQYGMDDYISKPIDEKKLYALVRKYIDITNDGEEILKELTEASVPSSAAPGTSFQFINTDYMEEIAQGDLSYKKLAGSLFLESVPKELAAMQRAIEEQRLGELNRLAHNFKTTISVMHPRPSLIDKVDLLEAPSTPVTDLDRLLQEVKTYFDGATLEAKAYLDSLS